MPPISNGARVGISLSSHLFAFNAVDYFCASVPAAAVGCVVLCCV